ncbi:ferritin-like domain-containing protein [Taibaiella koreensis]|uniref:ferritin-like domain-containing protein n=1 Tax=Taibaiella koreensis TaxID=1268548 RepID=UPI000E59A116|nr:PA2169 family four-helix-bundle protein [Taibaiella koreensis]
MQQTATETLNDLILINNDRIKGYERALKDNRSREADLDILFREMIEQSQRFNTALTALVQQGGSQPETEGSLSGKLHRAWMDFKTTFTGHNRKNLLIECERGEDASKEAYNEALHEDNGLTDEQREIIAGQAREQSDSHDRIKALRDETLSRKAE